MKHTKKFLESLRRRNCSPLTVKVYRGTLEEFDRFVGEGTPVTAADITRWIDSQSVSPKTLHNKLTHIRGYFRFCLSHGLVSTDPTAAIHMPKVSQPLPTALSIAETEAFLSVITKPRDVAFFTLAYRCGLRIAEICAIRRRDIDLPNSRLQVTGKGRKERTVPLANGLTDVIGDWLGSHESGFLFPGRNGHIAVRTMQSICRRYGRLSGIPDMHPHRLRHSFAVHCLDAGMPVHVLQKLLGHASISTTGRYTGVSDAHAAEQRSGIRLAGE